MNSQKNNYLIKAALGISVLVIARSVLTENASHLFLVWNIFLAYLPYYFSRKIIKHTNKPLRYILFVLWVLFLPNAPYLITDIIHLCDYSKFRQTADTLILFGAGLIGLMFYILSLKEMIGWMTLNYRYGKQETLLLIFSALSGFGLYLGRYLRLNSWEIFSKPYTTLYLIKNSLLNLHGGMEATIISLAFAIFLYFAFKFFQPFINANHEHYKKH